MIPQGYSDALLGAAVVSLLPVSLRDFVLLHGTAGQGSIYLLHPLLVTSSICCMLFIRLRWVKTVSEMNLMRASATIAAEAIQRCIQLSHTGVHERALATEFEYQVKMAGASRLAYPVVAGGGPDACTIHYSRNDKQVSMPHKLIRLCYSSFSCAVFSRIELTFCWTSVQITG